MDGEHAVGRVIARPFEGVAGRLAPARGPARLRRAAAGPLVPGGAAGRRACRCTRVGKIRDLFAGVGIDEKHEGADNAKGIAATHAAAGELDGGLIFVNLVETDQVYGHRHDVEGFHDALREIDAARRRLARAAPRRRPARS